MIKIKKISRLGHSIRYEIKKGEKNFILGITDNLLLLWGSPSSIMLNRMLMLFAKTYYGGNKKDKKLQLIPDNTAPTIEKYIEKLQRQNSSFTAGFKKN